jgi:hypothetical protein
MPLAAPVFVIGIVFDCCKDRLIDIHGLHHPNLIGSAFLCLVVDM